MQWIQSFIVVEKICTKCMLVEQCFRAAVMRKKTGEEIDPEECR